MAAIPDKPQIEDYLRADTLDPRQKALRDMFVSEYLIDYHQVNAAMRCGFPRDFAVQYAQQFMEEPYVQRRIKELEFTPADAKEEEEYNRKRITQQLLREAHYKGPGSSHSARVAALATLAKLTGMEPTKKTQVDFNMQGGVMRVPAPPSSADSWEQQAMSTQADLADGKIS